MKWTTPSCNLIGIRKWKIVAFRGAVTGSVNGTDHVLLRDPSRLRLPTRLRKITSSRLRVTALEMSEKKRALSTTIITVENYHQYTNGQSFGKRPIEDAHKSDNRSPFEGVRGKASKRLRDWISATTIHLSPKTKKVRLSGRLEHSRRPNASPG